MDLSEVPRLVPYTWNGLTFWSAETAFGQAGTITAFDGESGKVAFIPACEVSLHPKLVKALEELLGEAY